MDPKPERRLADRYRLVERISRGGMGEVWRARDEQLDRDVAVKVVRDDLVDDPVVIERFRREARAAASLTHPNVAAVYDLVDDDTLAIVMELLEGETLAEVLAHRGPLPPREAVEIVDGMLAGLEAAHAAGIVHRDIAPRNVMIVGDTVKVTDFGVAALVSDGASRLTDTGTVVGTAPYLAPEQVEGQRSSPATDQYAVAVVLYEMLTGARPFSGDTPATIALARLTVDPQPLRAHRAEVPRSLEDVVLRGLSRQPEHRFHSAGEMRAALAAAMGTARPDDVVTAPIAATATLTMPPTRQRGSAARRGVAGFDRRRLGYALAGLTLGVLALVVALAAAGSDGGRDATEAAEATEATTTTSTAPPCCVVPAVIGMHEADASAAVRAAGLEVGVVERVRDDEAGGTVVDQRPPSGTPLGPGERMDLIVSTGEDQDDDKDDDDKDDDERKGNGNGKRGKGDD
ncbi:MAG TPA: protein kinase [Acidimicrobiia bacterium]|nr:protein kinase [Acidimicrobiia bacterium]